MKEKDYIKVMNVSRKLTGTTHDIRKTSKQHKPMIDKLNDMVDDELEKIIKERAKK